jgi:hypothetical protein
MADGFPFAITNVVLDDGSVQWMVKYTNGISAEFSHHTVSMNFEPGSSLTASFDPQTKKLLKTFLERPATENGPGEYVRDLNADGIPDLRKSKGQSPAEVFYDGHWYPSKPGGGTNTLIMLQGQQVALYYDGSAWRQDPAVK